MARALEADWHTPTAMLRNYLKISLRVLLRNPVYSFINVVGLSLGLAACILIALYVRNEWTHDQFHSQSDNLYRVYRVEHRVRTPLKQSEGTMAPLAPAMQSEIGSVRQAARIVSWGLTAQRGDNRVETTTAFTDPAFLDMFDFGGNAEDLSSPNAIVLAESFAQRVFGDRQALGETLTLELGSGQSDFVVASVVPDPPTTSSIQFDLLAPFTAWPGYGEADGNWDSFSASTWVQLADGADPDLTEAALAGIVQQHYGARIAEMIESGWWADREDAFQLRLQPLRDVYLNPDIDAFSTAVSDPLYSFILLGIGLALLLLASANFMTLSLGRSITRSLEVGIRKTLGADRAGVAKQFWGEAVLLSFIALGAALVLAELALPLFNRLSGKTLSLAPAFGTWGLVLIGLALVTGLVAGSYPAVVLSAMRPGLILKGGSSRPRGRRFSRALMVSQFVIAIAMMAATLVMVRQMQFLETRDLGFEAEELLVVPLSTTDLTTQEAYALLEAEARAIPGVVELSASSSAFGNSWSRTVLSQDGVNHIVYTNYVEPSFLETLGIELVGGRNLSREFESDAESAVLINETFADAMGWDDPVGQPLPRWTDTQVVGVVRDFNNLSLHQPVAPVMLHMSTAISQPNYALIRFRTDRIREVRAGLERAWAGFSPDQPLAIEFMDQRLAGLYDAERRWSEIVRYAAGFAILITCMGLFGVATLSLSRRRKELGVRKVLGASVLSLVALASREFAVLVAAGFVVAAPIAYFAMGRWLQTFAYHTPLSMDVFLLAGAAALAISMGTIAFKATSAALADPVNSLRYE